MAPDGTDGAETVEDPGTSLVRLLLPDRPGGLALVTRCLAACGVDILNVDVVGHHDGCAVDDVLVRGGDLERGLRALEPEVRLVARRDRVGLPDPGLTMAAACAEILDAPSLDGARRALLTAACTLVFVDGAVLVRDGGGGSLTPVAATTDVPLGPIAADEPSLARRCLRSVRPAFATEADSWAPRRYREALPGRSVLALPVGTPPALALTLVRRDDFPFAEAEVDRLVALGRIAVRAFAALGERSAPGAVGPALRAASAG